MCWSGEASTVLAVIGLGTTAYAAYKKAPPQIWVTLGYFSLMELLQAYTYMVIDDCTSPANQVATLLGYLHIAFQPFFINALSMYFIPEAVKKRIEVWVYTICFASAIVMIVQVYPFDWAGSCHVGRPLCGPKLCSVSGNWHIAWEVPTNGIGNYFFDNYIFPFDDGFPSYVFAGMILPLIYGSWRITIYHYMLGPILAELLTDNVNEWPAIWCLLSIGLLILVLKTKLRDFMHVKSWFLWRKNWV